VILRKKPNTTNTVIKHLMVQEVLAEVYHGGMNMDDISLVISSEAVWWFWRRRWRSSSAKGSNLRIKVKLTLEELPMALKRKNVKRKVQAPGVTYKTCSTL
jgi:molecular chaperone DnaJ